MTTAGKALTTAAGRFASWLYAGMVFLGIAGKLALFAGFMAFVLLVSCNAVQW